MALITCPHCGKPVSDRAVKCPHCGCAPKEQGAAEKNNDVTPKEDSPTTPIIEQEESSSNRGKTIILFLLVAILAAIGGIFGYQKYCDLGYGPLEYEAPADSTAVEPLDNDTTAVDTVATTDDTQAKLEEFKNFRTLDLSAFMLRGKVKEVVESYGADQTVYTFNEQGKLIDGQLFETTPYKVRRERNKLILLLEDSEIDYEVDPMGRLVRCVTVGEGDSYEESKYSQFDENGWPTYSNKILGLEPDEVKTTKHITYKGIDEYGNWTIKNENGGCGVSRTITYYPID